MYKSLIRSTMKHNVILHVAQLLKSITCIFTISTVFCYMYDNTNCMALFFGAIDEISHKK